jgi:thiopeptide-type bacteriocin biosynthesis protein
MSRETGPIPELPVASDFFAWRTPSLPFDALLDWSRNLRGPVCPDDPLRLAESLAFDRVLLRERLRGLLDRPDVREALFLASPSLEQRIAKWSRDPCCAEGRDIECALVRYVQRMAARATPFGLFAGCSVGRIETSTRLRLEGAGRYRKHSRLDSDYLSSLIEQLIAAPETRAPLRYRPNSSLYRTAGRIRYAEERLADGGRSYHLVAVDATEYLEAALERSQDGATSRELAEVIARVRPDVTIQEAEAFVGELIDTRLLISELSLPVTGPEPIEALIAETGRHEATRETAARLTEARTILRELDAAGPGADLERYRGLAQILESLPARVDPSRLVQVDLLKPAAAAGLGNDVLSEIQSAIQILRRIATPPAEGELARFRQEFTARYDAREVPLVEALDDEVGVGFEGGESSEAEPLLADLTIVSPRAESDGLRWDERTGHLLAKLMRASERGETEVHLEKDDLERLSQAKPATLPAAFCVSVCVAAASEESLDRGEFRVLFKGLHGPSGARVLGRFCHADAVLRESVTAHLRAEEERAPGAIFAEIVHLPEGRTGNVIFRPPLREYEIPFLGRSGVAPERQIPVTDLFVSVAEGRIVLRSRRWGREVIPRLTSAHNFVRRSLPLYRFLCSLQTQGVVPGLGWSWGPLENTSFLPRVRCGRLVLSRARWRVPAEELKALCKESDSDRFLRVRRWRAQWKLPRFVLLSDGDNELPVDLENVLSIDAFADVVKNRESAILTEMFPPPDELCASGPEGRFVHELVVPFVAPASGARNDAGPRPSDRPAPAVRRSFAPGSEWLYAKLFTGTSTADRLLTKCVGPVVRQAMQTGAADRWFFIRYGDPEWHLRLRLHGPPARLSSEVLPALHAALESRFGDGQLWRLQLDTYERETERYGGPEGILVAEELFHADSETVLELLGLLGGDEGAVARWRLALWGIDLLLGDLGFDLARKLLWARQRRDSFGLEYGVDRPKRVRLGNRFRQERAALEELFRAGEVPGGGDHELTPELTILRAGSGSMAPIAERLCALSDSGRLTVSMDDMAASLVHMRINRLLRSAHRAQEAVLYDFLERIYDGRAARQRAARPAPAAFA